MSDVCQQIRQTSARRLVRSLLFRPRKLWEIAQGLSEEAQSTGDFSESQFLLLINLQKFLF